MIRNASRTLMSFALLLAAARSQAAKPDTYISVLNRSGQETEIRLSAASIKIDVDGKSREVRFADILSIHFGAEASASEKTHIGEWLAAVSGQDRKAAEIASERLVDNGLPALSGMLAAQDPNDTDFHEPHLLYSVFARIMPAGADRVDRTLDMIRLSDGDVLRGKIAGGALAAVGEDGKPTTLAFSDVRRIAVRKRLVTRNLPVHSLIHCTQIEWLDTGVIASKGSHYETNAEGIVRLSFDMDIWTSTPDALIRPNPTRQKRVIDGFPFGALLGRIGASNENMMLGAHMTKDAPNAGRFYLAINDNGHWQNNIGSYRVKMRVTDAYDVGDPAP